MSRIPSISPFQPCDLVILTHKLTGVSVYRVILSWIRPLLENPDFIGSPSEQDFLQRLRLEFVGLRLITYDIYPCVYIPYPNDAIRKALEYFLIKVAIPNAPSLLGIPIDYDGNTVLHLFSTCCIPQNQSPVYNLFHKYLFAPLCNEYLRLTQIKHRY